MATIGESLKDSEQEQLDSLAKEMNPAPRKKNKRSRRSPPIIKFAMTVEDGPKPKVDFRYNAGIDLYAAHDTHFSPVEAGGFYITTVQTTFILELPYGVHGMVAGRSGNAIKRGTVPFYGVIDNSYRGNTTVRLYTHSSEIARDGIKAGTAIAQLVPINLGGINLLRARLKRATLEELSPTARGTKGFGSSGRNV